VLRIGFRVPEHALVLRNAPGRSNLDVLS
jgi:hypothetical protein